MRHIDVRFGRWPGGGKKKQQQEECKLVHWWKRLPIFTIQKAIDAFSASYKLCRPNSVCVRMCRSTEIEIQQKTGLEHDYLQHKLTEKPHLTVDGDKAVLVKHMAALKDDQVTCIERI